MHQVHSALHHGHVREAQEDGVFVDRARGFFAAIDGMGGSYSGADAVTFIQKHLEETTLDANAPLPSLRGCLEAASARWWQVAQEDRRQQGSGATIATVWVHGGIAWVSHVGDSRAYLSRGGRLLPLTSDHTLAHDAMLLGLSAQEDAAIAQYRNIITRAIGFAEQGLEPTGNAVALEPGDSLLLCTDGLHDHVEDDTIAGILARDPEDPATALLDACLTTLAEDNIGIVTVTPDVEPEPDGTLDWGELRSSLHERTERGWVAAIRLVLAGMSEEDRGRAITYIQGVASAWPPRIERPAPLELLVGREHSGLLALCDAVELPEKTELQDWQWRFVLDHLESIRSVRIGLKRCAPEDLQGELRLLGELHAELLDRVTSSAV